MAGSHQTSLYDQLVKITRIYLGAASDRFVAHQLEDYLHKSPEELSPEDLTGVIDWTKIVVSLLTEDNGVVAECAAELQSLAKPSSGGRAKNTRNSRRR